ncbi:MAG: hypothetical protein H7Y38_18905, partial [Armatimonadetes bacterium]|nr:hypothetical protein [Armatimonadota bacterium]
MYCLISTFLWLAAATVAHAGWTSTATYTGSSSGFNSQGATGGTWGAGGTHMGVGSNCGRGGQATAETSGSVSVTYTWVMDATGVPAPKKVSIREEASARWGCGDFPQIDDEQMFGSLQTKDAKIGAFPNNLPVTYNSQQGGGVRGWRSKVYDVSANGTVTVNSGNLSANVTVRASTVTGAACNAIVTYSTGISDIRIKRDGVAIGDTNNKCLPGEAINLSVVGADANSTHSWSITGDFFKNYDPYVTPPVYGDGGAVVKTDPTITYRYIKGDSTTGSPKKVNVTVKVNNESVDVEDELKVYQPSFTFKAKQDGPSADLTGVVLERPRNVSIGSGMDWIDTTVSTPSHGSGLFGFLQ